MAAHLVCSKTSLTLSLLCFESSAVIHDRPCSSFSLPWINPMLDSASSNRLRSNVSKFWYTLLGTALMILFLYNRYILKLSLFSRAVATILDLEALTDRWVTKFADSIMQCKVVCLVWCHEAIFTICVHSHAHDACLVNRVQLFEMFCYMLEIWFLWLFLDFF